MPGHVLQPPFPFYCLCFLLLVFDNLSAGAPVKFQLKKKIAIENRSDFCGEIFSRLVLFGIISPVSTFRFRFSMPFNDGDASVPRDSLGDLLIYYACSALGVFRNGEASNENRMQTPVFIFKTKVLSCQVDHNIASRLVR